MSGKPTRVLVWAERAAVVARNAFSRPAYRRLAAGCGVFLVAMLAYLVGEMRGSSADRQVEQRYLARQVELLEEENRAASEQLSRLQTEQQVDREAYAQVEAQLAQLQGKIMEQQEELAFYRGVVGGPGQDGLSIRDFSLSGGEEGAVRLRFVLAQLKQGEREVRGQLQVRLEGTRAGRPVSLDAASLAESGKAARLAFAFRYFQDISLDLRVPADFAARRVIIRVLPTTRGVQPSVESFPWSTRSG